MAFNFQNKSSIKSQLIFKIYHKINLNKFLKINHKINSNQIFKKNVHINSLKFSKSIINLLNHILKLTSIHSQNQSPITFNSINKIKC
jgi:hypothetical protein